MKNFRNSIFLLVILIFVISCSSTKIIPDGYIKKENYTSANIDQFNNTLQLSIYRYDKKPALNKNRFLELVDDELEQLLNLLNRFEIEVQKYDFKDAYDIVSNDINNEDYVYIDYRFNDLEQFSIYLFDSSKNTLYYMYMLVLDSDVIIE